MTEGKEDLAAIVNKLTVPEGEVVAIVHPDIANAIYRAWKYKSTGEIIKDDSRFVPDKSTHTDRVNSILAKNNIKVGNTYMGMYGAIGEIELTMAGGDPSLVGVVHVPKPIFPIVELFGGGPEALKDFYKDFFKQTEGNEWKGNEWNIREQHSDLDVEQFQGIPFIFPQGYNWKLEKIRAKVFDDGRPLEQQVTDYESAVKRFIARLDQYIQTLNPAAAGSSVTPDSTKIYFEKLQTGEVKMPGSYIKKASEIAGSSRILVPPSTISTKPTPRGNG